MSRVKNHGRTKKLRNLRYCRASRDRNDTFSSVTVQETLGGEVGERNDWINLPAVIDNDLSAASGSKTRPGFEIVKQMVAAKKVDVVTVFSTSRATHDEEEFNALLKLLAASDVLLCVNGSMVDPNNPDDVLKVQVQNLFDSYFIKQLKKNTKGTLDLNAKNGLPHGRTPFGYIRVYDEKGKPVTQVEHMTEADAFRRYVRGFIDGSLKLTDIAREMDRSLNSVTGMLRSPTYIGVHVHQSKEQRAAGEPGVAYDAVWKGLITEDEHRAVIRLLDAAKIGPRTTATRKHPYTGVLFCAECGSRMTSCSPMRHGKRRVRVYRCNGLNGCTSIDADAFDEYLESLMQDAIATLATATDDGENDELVTLRLKLDALKDEAKELRVAFKAKRIDLDEYEDFRDDKLVEIAAVERMIDDACPTLELDWLVGQEIGELTDDEKHEAAKRLVDRVTVDRVGKGTGGRPVPFVERVHIDWR